MTNISGSKVNPVDWEMYQSMVYLKEWTGGWVILKGSLELIYITKDGQIERKKNNNEIGTELNPFSVTAYYEMAEKGYWPGGYIKYSDTGSVFYKQCGDGYGEKYASGCGSGCTTGCGENASISKGSKIVNVPPFSVVLSWDDGKANVGDDAASLYLTNIVYDSSGINMDKYNVEIDFAEAVWSGEFLVTITIRYHMDYGAFGDFYEANSTIKLN